MSTDNHLNYLREAYDLIVLTFFNKNNNFFVDCFILLVNCLLAFLICLLIKTISDGTTNI